MTTVPVRLSDWAAGANRQFWRQGLGFEAASATIAAGFEQLDLEAIGAETRPQNLPAQALLAKLGMQSAGTNTQGWPVYEITREEWLAQTCENPAL
jgi:RimJ/RimL family protein N-acetyltransferase